MPSRSVGITHGAALIFLIGTAIVWPIRADAKPSPSCITFIHNVQGGDTSHDGSRQLGILSDVYFAEPNDDCDRVVSMAVLGPNNSEVEWGWVLGYQEAAGNQYQGPGACNGSYFYEPELFTVWVPETGGYHCEDVLGLSAGDAGQVWAISVSDGNGNTIYDEYFKGEVQAKVNVDFSGGHINTNGERHSASDSMAADFDNLREKTVDHPSWYNFQHSHCSFDDDNLFDWSIVTDTHTKVLNGQSNKCS